MILTPVSPSDAMLFVERVHRHHGAPQGGLFAVAVSDGEQIVDVAIVGHPEARNNQDGWTAEVTRLATNGHANACPLLYAACWRAARAPGYRKLITCILDTETGTSLKAAGWRCIGKTKDGDSWNRVGRPRVDKAPLQAKLKWAQFAEYKARDKVGGGTWKLKRGAGLA